MEVVATTGARRRAMPQSNHHHQQTNTQYSLQAGCPSCRPTNSVKALNGKISHSIWTCLPQAHLGVFQLCVRPPIAPGYLGAGLPCLSSVLCCQYPYRNYTTLWIPNGGGFCSITYASLYLLGCFVNSITAKQYDVWTNVIFYHNLCPNQNIKHVTLEALNVTRRFKCQAD